MIKSKLVLASDVKARGAFYTEATIADFLVRWALRTASDMVIDPSFGGGVFLRAACQRLTTLGGKPAEQVFGVELHQGTHAEVTSVLLREFAVNPHNLIHSDFFELEAAPVRSFDAVVGNPPFVRYQRFNGMSRRRAMERAAEQGVRLSELSSSWAPFLIHSIALLKPGGRLAMVIPFEMFHAAYAVPVIEHLERSFATVTFLTFREKLFPDLSEDTILLLAEGKGRPHAEFVWHDVPQPQQLAELLRGEHTSLPGAQLDATAVASGKTKLIEYFIPRRAREIYRELCASSKTKRLGLLADVGVGYVTGANDYFHLDRDAVQRWKIPAAALRPAVRKSRVFAGLRFTHDDWQAALESGDAAYLLHISAQDNRTPAIQRYIEHGVQLGVPNAYKCRTRPTWYTVPHVYMPDLLLSYMSGLKPHLVTNDAGVVAPNNMHVVRMHPLATVRGEALAVAWQTSLTRLSVEIEGHALGGGMLKLEPTEAERVIVPLLGMSQSSAALAQDLDIMLRNGHDHSAQELADTLILRQGLGLSEQECRLLAAAADLLRERRYGR